MASSEPSGFQGKRVAVIGIGNELKGDDAAGILVARALNEIVQARQASRPAPIQGTNSCEAPAAVLVIDAGLAPENYTGPLRRFRPDLVVLIDAAELGKQPGQYAWVDWQEVDGFSASTHILPPSVFARYLVQELSCKVEFLGIQPATLDFDAKPSTPVLEAVSEIFEMLAARLAIT